MTNGNLFLFLLTLGNNILLQSFNWPKPVHYVQADKINASIHIQILKVKICIQQMRIFDKLRHITVIIFTL